MTNPLISTPHSDDIAVDTFVAALAAAMKAKLAKKRAEGYGGWNDPQQCSIQLLSHLLREHVEKGDPIDVANFAMMLHMRGSKILSFHYSQIARDDDMLRYNMHRIRAERHSARTTVIVRLEDKAERQRAYWERKQSEFPCIEDLTDDEGIFTVPDDPTPLFNFFSANGRYSEASWWLSTIRELKGE